MNLSKTRDKMLREYVLFQVIEMSLKHLKQNENVPHNDFTQPLFPEETIIQEENFYML